MKEILLKKLVSGDDNIQEVIELLDECEITREDLTESMESFKFPGVKRHSYSELDTKAKTAFTRMCDACMLLQLLACGVLTEGLYWCDSCCRYNKASHKSQAVVESVLGSTTIKKGRGKAAAKSDDDGLPPPSDAESEPDEEEDLDVSKFQKKARGVAKRKAPAAAAKKAPRKAPAKKRRT
ncbi:unnamed protein product [Phytophthora fragariaefolia]|uniref:Unnamed protein product n=1 Tax=Phytophthora fragariaefolia TaxID=1490495 RepID=A0A9W6WV52_9STRA|nr:unnamed protein product [Phytophthora fragariaefolia]